MQHKAISFSYRWVSPDRARGAFWQMVWGSLVVMAFSYMTVSGQYPH